MRMALPLLLALICSSAIAGQYDITPLGTLGGIWSAPADLDNQGRVVGGSTVQSGAWHAFRWADGQMEDLGVPGDYLVSGASALNSEGKIVGYANGEFQSQFAYLWEDNVWTYLGTLPGQGLDYSVAADINDNSQICGYSFTLGPGSSMRGWIWENGEMTDLGTLGGDKSFASAINEQGQIVGYAQVDNPDYYETHAFIWENGEMTDLGVLPGEVNSAAYDINEHGQIVGSSSHQMDTYPFLTISRPCLWDNGQVIDLGLVGGYARGFATAISSDGTITGWMATSLSGGTRHAFVWRDGVWTDLNSLIPPDSEWELQSVGDINDHGQIIGSGEAPGGSIQGFLLNPVLTGVDDDIVETIPTDFDKLSNYPNPFNAETLIEYSLTDDAHVTIDIYDMLGRHLTTLVDANRPAGNNQVVWDAAGQASGVYFYSVRVGETTETRKMSLLK